MAVERTGAIYKSLFFDEEDSRDYGVYITGQAVYNAPEREVEMISIPGRNGALALDKGRFENIEVTYPAGIYADTEADFAEAISNFRNLLCSRRGYVRLQDEYNPNEYRMAIYKSGLEVEPTMLKAGEFEIVFDCKPQRWLTSGEDAISVDSGDVVSNPTLFESSPLLAVDGYGIITINGIEAVEITGGPLGQYLAKEAGLTMGVTEYTFEFDYSVLNVGDTIYELRGSMVGVYWHHRDITSFSVLQDGDAGQIVGQNKAWYKNGRTYLGCMFSCDVYTDTFSYGTPRTYTTTLSTSIPTGGSDIPATATCTIAYDGIKTISMGLYLSTTDPYQFVKFTDACSVERKDLYAYSSQSILGNPLYVDCDLGEAYKIEGGALISINNGVSLGSDLPKLASGANTITYDNTVTDLKVVPRWWKI